MNMSRSLLLSLLAVLLLVIGLASLAAISSRSPCPSWSTCSSASSASRRPSNSTCAAISPLSAPSPDQPITVTLTLTNRGVSLDELLVEDILPAGLRLLDGSNRHLTTLPAANPAPGPTS